MSEYHYKLDLVEKMIFKLQNDKKCMQICQTVNEQPDYELDETQNNCIVNCSKNFYKQSRVQEDFIKKVADRLKV